MLSPLAPCVWEDSREDAKARSFLLMTFLPSRLSAFGAITIRTPIQADYLLPFRPLPWWSGELFGVA